MVQSDPPRPPRETLPTMYDLPSEDPQEPGLPDEFHLLQPRLLDETFCPPAYAADQVFTASDLNLYYDSRRPQWYKRPDWFAVVGVPRLHNDRELRLSYVIWQEGIPPFVAIELLSPATQKEDLGGSLRSVDQPPTKWEVYQTYLRIPYYGVFDRQTSTLRMFVMQGDRYEAADLPKPEYWIPGLGLGLGVWQGTYRGHDRPWLRWYDAQGQWLPTLEERAAQEQQAVLQERQRAEQAQQRAEQAQQQAEQAQQQAEQAHQRAERLAARLRELGVDPSEL